MIDFDAQAAQFVRMRVVHPSQRLQLLSGGGVRLTMQVGNLIPVRTWVLEWGARARVVEPPELVQMVTEELSEALKNYSKPVKDKPVEKKAKKAKKRTTS